VGERFTKGGEVECVALANVGQCGGMVFAFRSELIVDGVPCGLCARGVLEGLFFGGGFSGEFGFEGGVALA
jgi:hypothetical protein